MTTPISDKIHHALSQIDNALLAQNIWLILQEQKFVGFLPHFAVQHLCNKHQITPQQLSLQLLPIAACYATTPISDFNVGAIVTGVNFAKQIFNKPSMPNKAQSVMLGCAEKKRSPTLASTTRHVAIVASL